MTSASAKGLQSEGLQNIISSLDLLNLVQVFQQALFYRPVGFL